MDFIWKAELKHYSNAHKEDLRQFFIDELSSLFEASTLLAQTEVRKIVEDSDSQRFQFPFTNKSTIDEATENEIASIGSNWYYWSALTLSKLRQASIAGREAGKTTDLGIAHRVELESKQGDEPIYLSFTVNDVFTRFTRYEGKRFIILYLTADAPDVELQTPEAIIAFQKK